MNQFSKIILIILLLTGSFSVFWLSSTAKNEQAAATQSNPIIVNVIKKFEHSITDFTYDEEADIVYATVNGSGETEETDYVMMIQGATGEILDTFFVGKDPSFIKLSNDQSQLYVNYDNNMIKRMGMETDGTEVDFGIFTTTGCGSRRVEDMVIFDNNPETIAVSIKKTSCSPRHIGVAIYDNGVQRPTMATGHTGSNQIEPSEDPKKLYGYTNETSGHEFMELTLDANGVTENEDHVSGLLYGNTTIEYYDGKIYSSNGQVIDPVVKTELYQYAMPDIDQFKMSIDPESNRIFFLAKDFSEPIELFIFELNSSKLIARKSLSNIHYSSVNSPVKIQYLDNDILAISSTKMPLALLSLHELGERSFLPAMTKEYCARPFFDDFSDPTSGWPITTSGTSTYRYFNQEYNILHPDQNRWTAITRGDRMEFGATGMIIDGRVAANEAVWGVIFGLTDDWKFFHTFEILPEQKQWYLFKFNHVDGWTLLESGNSSAILSGTQSNEIAILRNGSLSFQINGVEVTRLGERPGRVGITGGSFTKNVDLRYDDYTFANTNCPIDVTGQSQLNPPQSITIDRPQELLTQP